MNVEKTSGDMERRMKVITLCGSTRFKRQFREMEAALTLQGHVVISLGFFEQSDNIPVTPEQALLFERIHRRKIDLADEMFVIDPDGYIGESTRSEIAYAMAKGNGPVLLRTGAQQVGSSTGKGQRIRRCPLLPSAISWESPAGAGRRPGAAGAAN